MTPPVQNPFSSPARDPGAGLADDQRALADQLFLCRRAGRRRDALVSLADRALAFAVPRLMSLVLLCGAALATAASLIG